MSEDVGGQAAVIRVSAEMLADMHPSHGKATVTFRDEHGETTYRLLEWDYATCTFLAATPEGEATLKARGVARLRDALTEAGEGLGE